MNGTPRVAGDNPLMAIKYKYRSQKVLEFISMGGRRGVVITVAVFPSLSCYPDKYSNVSIFLVLHPHLLGI